MITRTFKLCLNAGTGSAPYINVNQYDEGETWLFELYTEQGERYMPTTGAIVGIKSDGKGIANTGTVDSNGRVVITETEQMTASAGLAIFELSIDDLSHGTANFAVQVERKPTDDAIMSESDYSMFQEAIDAAEVINDVIGDSDPSEVIGEHVDAWLDNHPEATTTVEDGAITAPKINSTLWDKLLVNEEASGNPASFSDGADDVPVSSLKVALEPVQLGSGDPSPSNVRPIIAANGKNILQVTGTTQTINGVTFTVNADGTIRATGTATSNRATFSLGSVNFKANTGYILNGCPSGGSNSTYNMNIAGAFSVDTGNGGAVYTPTADVTYAARIDIYPAAGNVDLLFKPMIRLASITDSIFQPYQGIMVDVFGGNLIDLAGKWSENAAHYGYTAMLPAGTYYAYVFTEGNEAAYNSIAQYSLDGTTYTDILTTDNGYAVCDATMQYNRKKSRITLHQSAYIRIGAQGANHVNKQIYVLLTPNGSEYDSMPNVPPYAYASTLWMPYVTPTQYPYTLGQSVYGGTVDLATGVLTVTWVTITLDGSEAWGVGNTDQGFYTSTHTMLKAIDYTSVILCDKLKTYERMNKSDYYGATNGITGYNDGSNQYPTQNWIYAKGGGATTPTEFKTWLASNPLTVVYELATPQTIQLTPTEVKTFLGYNNISSSGTVDVIYHADTKLYVDKMTAVDNNIIAPTEATFTATRNYTVNDLVIVNDTLYKVTSNIQNGGTITPNSNVTQTTLSALIKALS